MLVLARNIGERLLIGPNVEILVSRIEGDRVHLAIKAPQNIRVDRAEVREARMREARHEAQQSR